MDTEGDEATLGLLLPVLSGMQEGPEVEEQGREPRQEEKRSYSMEHFRWGKPVGRKRRPIKVFPSAMEEESSEAYPAEMRRELLANWDYAQEEEGGMADDHPQHTLHAKKDSSYKMKHFRWNGPPASKRYGGFMKPWGERSQKPLLTLFKNVIIKDGQQKKAQWRHAQWVRGREGGRKEGKEGGRDGQRDGFTTSAPTSCLHPSSSSDLFCQNILLKGDALLPAATLLLQRSHT